MRFTPDNFLYALRQIVTGGGKLSNSTLPAPDGGFNQDVNVGLNSGPLASGATLTTSNNVPIISSAASSTALLINTNSFIVPRDYDQTTDKVIVRIFAKSAGTTDTPTLTVASSTTVLAGTVGVAAKSITGAAISNKVAVYEYDLSGLGLVRDEILSFTLTSAVHNTDAVQVFAIELVYASTLVAFTDGNLTGGDPTDLAGLDALGNPLR